MSLSKPFEENNLQNSSQFVKNANIHSPMIGGSRSAPMLPPRPSNFALANGYNNFSSPNVPYSGYGGCNSSYNTYNSYGSPYRSTPYTSYGSSYNNYGSFGSYPNYAGDDHERRFIQYAEESSRNTFASVENIVRAFNSIAMMLDNTFFAMTSSFRAVLSVAENFGRLRTMFGQIWYSINIFRFFSWMYRKLMKLVGYNISSSRTSVAWKQANNGASGLPGTGAGPGKGSSWPTIAFLGVLMSAPYLISRFLPKYEDKGDPANWKSPGIRAKAVFDFIATAPNELTIQANDLVLLAPTSIQEEMNLKNTGWAFAVCKAKSGLVPLNYLVISKNRPILSSQKPVVESDEPPIPRVLPKTHTKRVSFGENQIFENVDLEDYLPREDNYDKSKEMLDTSKQTETEIVDIKSDIAG